VRRSKRCFDGNVLVVDVPAFDLDNLGFFAAWQFPAVHGVLLFCLIFHNNGRIMSPAGKTFANVFLHVHGTNGVVLDEPVPVENKKIARQVRRHVHTIHLRRIAGALQVVPGAIGRGPTVSPTLFSIQASVRAILTRSSAGAESRLASAMRE
jgi:hypothetical protein